MHAWTDASRREACWCCRCTRGQVGSLVLLELSCCDAGAGLALQPCCCCHSSRAAVHARCCGPMGYWHRSLFVRSLCVCRARAHAQRGGPAEQAALSLISRPCPGPLPSFAPQPGATRPRRDTAPALARQARVSRLASAATVTCLHRGPAVTSGARRVGRRKARGRARFFRSAGPGPRAPRGSLMRACRAAAGGPAARRAWPRDSDGLDG
jgi:hypothetical protein